MSQQLDTTAIAIILFMGLLAHVALVAVSRWINPVVLLGGIFMLLTPLAVADIVGQNAAKWARVYCTVLMVVVGVFYSRHYRLGPALGLYLFFAILYVIAGVWSEHIFQALKFKGLFFALIFGGGFMAYSIRSEMDLRKGLRLFVIISGLIAIIMLTDFVRNPAAISRVGRFEPWGLVATRVGAICGPLGVICAFCALYDHDKVWKVISYSVGSALCLCIVYSGSRGGLFMAGIGCFVIGLPIIRRPILAASVLGGALLLFYGVTKLTQGSSEATERLLELNFDSRAEKWALARAIVQDNLLFGIGWVYSTEDRASGSTDNMHSIYLQVAVEMGVFGVIVFGTAMSIIVSRALWVIRQARRIRCHVEIAYFAVGISIAVLSYGLVESAPLMGGTIVAMLLAFGIALIDRVSEMVKEEMIVRGIDSYSSEHWDDQYSDGRDDGDHNPHDELDDTTDDHHEADHDNQDDSDEAWDDSNLASEDLVDGY